MSVSRDSDVQRFTTLIFAQVRVSVHNIEHDVSLFSTLRPIDEKCIFPRKTKMGFDRSPSRVQVECKTKLYMSATIFCLMHKVLECHEQ